MRYGIGYKVSVREVNSIKNIELTSKLITRFFDCKEWWAKEKTITRYVNNYNELKRTESNQPESSASNNLKATFPAQTIIGVIALQITDLQNFLNFKNKMSANQILDTAEFILEDFEILSFTMIQDCFNRVKRGLPPFDKVLYQSLSGRKILDFLAEYDRMVDYELIDREHERKQLRLPAPENKQDARRLQAFTNLHHQLGKLKESYNDLKKK